MFVITSDIVHVQMMRYACDKSDAIIIINEHNLHTHMSALEEMEPLLVELAPIELQCIRVGSCVQGSYIARAVM